MSNTWADGQISQFYRDIYVTNTVSPHQKLPASSSSSSSQGWLWSSCEPLQDLYSPYPVVSNIISKLSTAFWPSPRRADKVIYLITFQRKRTNRCAVTMLTCQKASHRMVYIFTRDTAPSVRGVSPPTLQNAVADPGAVCVWHLSMTLLFIILFKSKHTENQLLSNLSRWIWPNNRDRTSCALHSLSYRDMASAGSTLHAGSTLCGLSS